MYNFDYLLSCVYAKLTQHYIHSRSLPKIIPHFKLMPKMFSTKIISFRNGK